MTMVLNVVSMFVRNLIVVLIGMSSEWKMSISSSRVRLMMMVR